MTSDEFDKKQSDKLVDLVLGYDDIVLFHDEYGTPFARLQIGGHSEIWPCGGVQFKRWLSKTGYDNLNKAPSTNTISAALNIIEAEARFNGQQRELRNRVAELDGAIYYDLADREWRTVKVDGDGWAILAEPPILFKRFQHHAPQVEPVAGGKVQDVLPFLNVTNPEHQILVLVHLVSCFVPGFAHPIPYIYGQQGSAKSTFSKVMRKLIDPSRL